MYFVFIQLLSSGPVWFAILLMGVTCLFLDVVKKVFDRHLHPTSTEKAQVRTFILSAPVGTVSDVTTVTDFFCWKTPIPIAEHLW